MAGGWPVAAIAGRADLMEPFGTGEVNHSGTFNGSLMAAAAIVATQKLLLDDPPYERHPGLWHRTHGATGEGRRALRRFRCACREFRRRSTSRSATPRRSATYVRSTRSTSPATPAFATRLAEHGLWLAQRGIWYVSAAHGDEDLADTLERFEVGACRATSVTRRVGIVGVWHETNTYSARPATLADFEDVRAAHRCRDRGPQPRYRVGHRRVLRQPRA